MSKLESKHCVPCEGGVKPLGRKEIDKLLVQTPSWQLNEDATIIYRRFTFKNYYQTISFINAVAWIANQENHHPDLEVSYNHCTIKFHTHAIGGLSENDFICASKINLLALEL